MRAVVLIPARYASSRYPGKPLVELLGKPMILWVAERAALAVGRENVVVATEDERIADVVRRAGFGVAMTSDTALTGTDRIAEASAAVQADIYVNVQGDEPMVDPADIRRVIEAKQADMGSIINGFSFIGPDEDPDSVNIPKVVVDIDGRLLYMSRKAVPGFKDAPCAPARYRKQVCIYAFTAEELALFRGHGAKTELERSEDIEILRFLELGRTVKMVETRPGTLAVDVPSDVAAVESALRKLVA